MGGLTCDDPLLKLSLRFLFGQTHMKTMAIKLCITLAAAALIVGCKKEGAPPDNAAFGNSSSNNPAAPAPSPSAGGGASAEVKTTASGLKYQVMKQGTGTASPKATDTVQVHYHGTLLDGTVFDSSVERGQPATFPLNRVIGGWTEGVQLMKVGDKFKFEIPPALAYGERSPSPKIPPNSTLVFEVELLAIQ
jgi:FKBP-type peptidyl-prolyl cis-trans isomerase